MNLSVNAFREGKLDVMDNAQVMARTHYIRDQNIIFETRYIIVESRSATYQQQLGAAI